MPAEWATVRRLRVKDSIEYVWWFSKTPFPKADNRKVLRPYSEDMIRLSKRGVRATVRPSGHNIESSFDKIGAGGAIPPNVVEDDMARDIFGGSNTAGQVAEAEGRKWLSFEVSREYVAASAFRFLDRDAPPETMRRVYEQIMGGEGVEMSRHRVQGQLGI